MCDSNHSVAEKLVVLGHSSCSPHREEVAHIGTTRGAATPPTTSTPISPRCRMLLRSRPMLLRARPMLLAQPLAPNRVAATIRLSQFCTRKGDILDAKMWTVPIDSPPALRFPIGTPVRCFVGGETWLAGTVVAQHYREANWPKEQPTAAYQILVDEKHLDGAERSNAIWAPADTDDMIQTNFRFALGATAECRVGLDEWCTCTVIGHIYRERHWPAAQHVPYQVRVESVLPGSINDVELEMLVGKLIWLAKDDAQNIRAVSAERAERLRLLVRQREDGLVGEEEFAEQRARIVRAE